MIRCETIKEATERWVQEMNAIPQGMISKIMDTDTDDWSEVTEPKISDRVNVYDFGFGTIQDVLFTAGNEDIYVVELDEGKPAFAEVCKNEFEIVNIETLPMWGMMWSFGSSCDDWWLENDNGIQIMSECGFRIYKSEEYGYFFGIDGAGYDFYAAHWIPLYRKRGLQWHSKAYEIAEYMVEDGIQQTESGNYIFYFDEIEKEFGLTLTDKIKRCIKESVYKHFSKYVCELLIDDESFDFMFYTNYCPNADYEGEVE